MKKIYLFLILALITEMTVAQSYNTSGGLRLGTEWGLTVKHRIAKRVTLEGIVQSSIKRNETTLTLLAERHFPIITKRLNVYYGGGVHKGWATGNDVTYDNPAGLTFIGGAEFTFARINVSWDFKPSFNLVGGEKKLYSHTGVSIRYVLVKRPLLASKKERERRKRKRKKGKKDSNWKFWEKN